MRYSVCFPVPLICSHVALSNRYCKFFSDPKNSRVQSYAKIVEFPKFHVHRIGPASSKNENPMLYWQSATSETFEYKVPRKSLGSQNIMSSILDPPFRIPKIRCQIHNQRPQKPPSTELCEYLTTDS